MRYLTLGEVLEIYRRVMDQSGGMAGIRDLGGLESAVAQPRWKTMSSKRDDE